MGMSVEFKVGEPEEAVTRQAIRTVTDPQDARMWFVAGFSANDMISFTDAELIEFKRAHPDIPVQHSMFFIAKHIGSDGKGVTIFVAP